MIRTYTELSQYSTLEDRFNYLVLKGSVAAQTFGHERYLNQNFYRSREWKQVRRDVIARDLGCDLGVEGYEIHDKALVHHMNPMGVDNIIHGDEDILNPEYLITVTHNTHNAIHYGDANLLPKPFIERRPGDTRLW
ncbi:HNH endonuclease [Arthrobacter phage Hankly]|nr:HNH endonuclease [Arthrobacter phage Hankly]